MEGGTPIDFTTFFKPDRTVALISIVNLIALMDHHVKEPATCASAKTPGDHAPFTVE